MTGPPPGAGIPPVRKIPQSPSEPREGLGTGISLAAPGKALREAPRKFQGHPRRFGPLRIRNGRAAGPGPGPGPGQGDKGAKGDEGDADADAMAEG